ncbi:MAG: galactosyltransferase-related protein, partial [Lapillicoccus sp.]
MSPGAPADHLQAKGSPGHAPTARGVAVITLAHGRHGHLRAQILGLRKGTRRPEFYVVAAMGDEAVGAVVAASPPPATRVSVVDVPATAELPLSTARNRAAATAIRDGAEVLVFLDVDCIPAPDLVETYARACDSAGGGTAAEVFSGAVHYLAPPRAARGYTDEELGESAPHPARPVVRDTERELADDLRLFWSLSFGLTARSWDAVGGFDEGYSGYGGEDTDFAMRLDRAGGRLWWVRGGVAYHQHHEVESPPVRHLEAIVRNSNLFHERWGHF